MNNSNSDTNQLTGQPAASNDTAGSVPPLKKHFGFSQAFTGKAPTSPSLAPTSIEVEASTPPATDRWTPSDQDTNKYVNDWESPFTQAEETDVVPKARSADVITSTSHPKPKRTKKPVLGVLMALLLVIGAATGFYLVNQNQELRQQASTNKDTVIATVGQEKIYQRDLDTELQYFPPVDNVDGQPVEEYLLEKIIQDSQVLQAMGKTNDPTIYNSSTKDYLKRTSLVQDLLLEQEAKLITENASVTGIALTMWYNNQDFGKQSLEERKSTVQQKITSIHERVSSGALTIEAAVEEIKNDSSLAVIDPSYQGNAEYPFGLVNDNDLINGSAPLTTAVRNLDVGGVSQVYDHNLSDNEQMFIFAVVTNKQANRGSSPKDLEAWLNQINTQFNVQK